LCVRESRQEAGVQELQEFRSSGVQEFRSSGVAGVQELQKVRSSGATARATRRRISEQALDETFAPPQLTTDTDN